MSEETLFHEALAKPAGERASFLDAACAGDADLRQRLEILLRAHDNPGSFLGAPAVSPEATAAPSPGPAPEEAVAPAVAPSAVIGPYKLLQEIGEGGMGTVWMAQQTEPVKRLVALKVIKPGMNSRQVIARFEAERQALALMEHPNIARVLDAGTTATGRPYFVMELVKGVPITRYCDEHRLTPKQRLELLVPVCQAVQHAHQKGIIHRDLKPSNVLVAEYDDRPVAKVIDFGVAKATGPKLTERTLFTEFGQVVGTLEYMSPEQAKLNALDIDTRSDIHALGVLLYELLTGTTPFDRKRLSQAAFDEVLRIIREEEPPKPSARLSTTEELPAIAANRSLEPKKLSGLVRGELDWIVMKCLEKDRGRRYATANDLASDVQRYLADEAVQACPPSAGYRLRKFVRRNQGPVLAVSVVALALVGGIVGTTWGMLWAIRAEADARTEATEKGRAKKQAEADRERAQLRFEQAHRAVDRMYSQVAVKWLTREAQTEPVQREFLEEALKFYQSLTEQESTDQWVRHDAARAYQRVGDIHLTLRHFRRSFTAFTRAIAALEALVADYPATPEHLDLLAASLHGRALLHGYRHRHAEAGRDHVRAVRLRAKLVARFPAERRYRQRLSSTLNNHGVDLMIAGSRTKAEAAFRRAMELAEQLVTGPGAGVEDRCTLARVKDNLSRLLWSPNHCREAERLTRDAVALQQKAVEECPSELQYRIDLAKSQLQLARILNDTGRVAEALSANQRASRLLDRLVEERPHTPVCRFLLAECRCLRGVGLARSGRTADADRSFREALTLYEKLLAECPDEMDCRSGQAWCQLSLGDMLHQLHQEAEGERLMRQANATYRELAARAPKTVGYRERLALTWHRLGSMRLARNSAEAEAAYEKAIALRRQLRREVPRSPANNCMLGAGLHNLALIRLRQERFQEARPLLTEALKYQEAAVEVQPRGVLYRQFLRNHCQLLAETSLRLGDHAEAARFAERCPQVIPEGWEEHCRAAVFLSRCAELAAGDTRLSVEDRRRLAQAYGDRAMPFLRQAVARGYDNVTEMKTARGWAPLRERDDFRQLVRDLEARKKP
jgi:serine/threonine protein kinase/tetratricopeptide (TPR) repeat protein